MLLGSEEYSRIVVEPLTLDSAEVACCFFASVPNLGVLDGFETKKVQAKYPSEVSSFLGLLK